MGGEDKHGAVQFRLPGSPFALQAGKDSATIGKLFAIRIFEEMNHLGYDLGEHIFFNTCGISLSLFSPSPAFKKAVYC